jgi:putative transposase
MSSGKNLKRSRNRRKRISAAMRNGTQTQLGSATAAPVEDAVLPNDKKSEVNFDESTEEQLKTFAQNAWLVSLIEKGIPATEALRRLNLSRGERSVRQLARRYQKHGYRGLIDRRWTRKTENFALTPEIKKLALALYFTYSAAGNRAIWSELIKECRGRQLPEPSESSVKKFLNSLPEAYRMFRRGKPGIRQWEQTAAPVIRYENTVFANERWQADDSPLPIWVRVKTEVGWIPAVARMTVSLDAHTRSIPGYVVSTKHPDLWTISLMLRRAILPKSSPRWKNRGIPFIWQCDRGKNYLSHAIVATLKRLHTELDPDPPYYPNRKGKVERFFQTLDSGCLRLLPGHQAAIGITAGAAIKKVHELLTIQQLDAEIERWIIEDYHQRVHSETRRKPEEFWEETLRLRMPESDDDLNLLLLKDDIERTVKNTGITLKHSGIKYTYWAPDLLYHFKRRVRLAYNPEDMESVLVYCAATRERICEAFDLRGDNPHYTIDDIRASRSQFRRGLAARIKDYHNEIKAEDRRALRVAEWQEAREELSEEETSDTADVPYNPLIDDDVIKLMDEFRCRDRAES